MQQFEREATQSPTPRARACKRRPGQRLKKAERRKLQARFIEILGTVHNGAAMEALGLSRFTLYAWLRDPEFKARYDAKLATYELKYEPMTDEQYEQAARRLAMMPDWKIVQQIKIRERMQARRGKPADIWW